VIETGIVEEIRINGHSCKGEGMIMEVAKIYERD
jgi:hypothetical protein